ncbi:hypothetical protein VTK73DRAFT_4575 [Phialemonium thermophilum]|uniref:Peptidase A1 domain-containing protein n=1 Tax=Phialemonium thermophilum TaxID=223376 RepID=A0ABR3V9E2_9PEZI
MTGADGNVDAYDPVFTSMWKSDQVQPLFSIALSRELGDNNKSAVGAPASSSSGNSNNNGAVKDTSGGAVQESSYLAFGGIPPVPYDNATWTRTPILSMQEMPSWGIDENVQGLYVIRADAYVYGRPPANASTNASTTDADSTEGLVVDTTQFPILIDCGSSLTRLPTRKWPPRCLEQQERKKGRKKERR